MVRAQEVDAAGVERQVLVRQAQHPPQVLEGVGLHSLGLDVLDAAALAAPREHGVLEGQLVRAGAHGALGLQHGVVAEAQVQDVGLLEQVAQHVHLLVLEPPVLVLQPVEQQRRDHDQEEGGDAAAQAAEREHVEDEVLDGRVAVHRGAARVALVGAVRGLPA